MKILVIEDDPDVIETIRSVFENFFSGVEITHISHGEQFRKGEWRDGGWDLVVLDLMIPGMTGFEICDQLRACPRTRTVPVFALTGYDTLQNEERIRESGATKYLAKPFEVGTFVEELQKVLGRPHRG